jgi:SecD/SecF fusion protein
MNFFNLLRHFLFFIFLSSSFILFPSCNKKKEKRKPNLELEVEVSMRDMISFWAFERSREAYFQRAISKTDSIYRIHPDSSYLNIFIAVLKNENPAPLSEIFPLPKSLGGSNEKVIQFLRTNVDLTVQRAMKIIGKRLNSDSSEVYSIKRVGRTNRIQIRMYASDINKMTRMITNNAEIYFCEVLTLQDIVAIFNRVDSAIMKDGSLKRMFIEEGKEGSVLRTLASTNGSNDLLYEFADTAKINSLLSHPAVRSILPPEVSYYWVSGKKASNAELLFMYNHNAGRNHWISGEVIEKAKFALDDRNDPMVEIEMDSKGTQYWKAITNRLSSDPNAKGRIAVLVDQICYMAPTVQSEIPDGRMVISGNFTADEVKELVFLIQCGALSSKCYIVSEKQI